MSKPKNLLEEALDGSEQVAADPTELNYDLESAMEAGLGGNNVGVRRINLNLADVEDNDLPPEGLYLARAEKVELRDSQTSPGNQYLNFTYAIQNEGEYYGRKVWAMGPLSQKALWRTKKIYLAHGIPAEQWADLDADAKTGVVTSPDFTQNVVGLRITHEEYEGSKRAKVADIMSKDLYIARGGDDNGMPF